MGGSAAVAVPAEGDAEKSVPPSQWNAKAVDVDASAMLTVKEAPKDVMSGSKGSEAEYVAPTSTREGETVTTAAAKVATAIQETATKRVMIRMI